MWLSTVAAELQLNSSQVAVYLRLGTTVPVRSAVVVHQVAVEVLWNSGQMKMPEWLRASDQRNFGQALEGAGSRLVGKLLAVQ